LRLDDPIEPSASEEDAMGVSTIDEQREAMLQIAQAIAPTWERRRADIAGAGSRKERAG
jgi:hypothetical protein